MHQKRNYKADEMEMAINMKAMRCGWIFLITSLTIWCLVETIVSGVIPSIPFILECVSCVIFFSVKIWLTKKMTKPESETDEE